MKTGNAIAGAVAAAAIAAGGVFMATVEDPDAPRARAAEQVGKAPFRDKKCVDTTDQCKGSIAEYSPEFGCLICPSRD